MADFRTSLLREKFTITEKKGSSEPEIALSNRIVIPLISQDGVDNETFIVRTQNMHSCVRFAAAITKEFFERGTIAHRSTDVPWSDMWGNVIKGFERDWNHDIWCVVYLKGQAIFEQGKHHPFLDIIEQCDSTNKQEYEKSISVAEKEFSKMGTKVTIEHNSNIALVMSSKEEQAKCGIIVRVPNGTTTFNYTAVPQDNDPRLIHPHTTLTVAAAFLEGVQLSFQVGFMNKKQDFHLITRNSEEDRKHTRSINRLGNLNRAILKYEENLKVRYRPDRPKFKDMVSAAEEFSIKALKSQIEEKIADGDLNPDNWVL